VSVDKVVIQSQYSHDLGTNGTHHFVSADHFGGNIIATRNSVVEGGPFQQGLDSLGITGLRYPGGTITEQYFDPHGSVWDQLFGANRSDNALAADGTEIIGPKPFFNYANENGHSVTFVLPTASLLTKDQNGNTIIDHAALEEVKATVGEIIRGSFGPVTIDAFEIGNEYYHFADLTAKEYGAVANELIKAIGEEYRDFEKDNHSGIDWDRPDIAIQAGAGWQHGDNEQIIACLDSEARSLVDRVAIHYYPQDHEQVEKFDGIFNQIDAWEGASDFHEMKFYASEWNIQNSPGSDTGLSQASSLISAFDEMIKEGVDAASIWGVQNRWLDTSLTTLSSSYNVTESNPQAVTRLTASGEIFASMSESLNGLQSFSINRGALFGHIRSGGLVQNIQTNEIVVNSFGDHDRAVIYISSRSDQVVQFDLDLSQYFIDPSHIWGEVLTTVDDPSTPTIDESDPKHSRGLPVFETLSANQLDEHHIITLEPHAIIRINVQLDGSGVTMLGHNPLTDDSQDYQDSFTGSSGADSINGYAGDDSLSGMVGDDVINGESGNDVLFGGSGNDLERGGTGNDQIVGQAGNDILVGGDGNDQLTGSSGNDMISGGEGDDLAFGGSGNDLIRVGDGNDTAFGGEGSDYFIVSPMGETHIKDWDFSGDDRITFLGQYHDANDLLEHAIESEVTGDKLGDLTLTNDAGGEIVFVGASGHLDDLISQVVDFTEAGQDALQLADNLNDMSGNEMAIFMDSLSSEDFQNQILNPDPVILLASLNADKAAQFLNSMDPDEGEDFLDHVGREGLASFFEELNVAETESFVETIAAPALSTVLDQYGGQEFFSHLDDCGESTRTSFLNKVDGTKFDYLDRGHHLPDGHDIDPGTGELPSVPSEEEAEGNGPDEEQIDTSGGACFIATVAYSDANHKDVWTLRWYRDHVLRRFFLGRLFIQVYWIVGPKLADAVRNRPRTTGGVRFCLSQFVRVICWYYGRTSGRQTDHILVGSGRTKTDRTARVWIDTN
jgi:Ca2+-binding RTX toxin-like protein